MLCYFFYLLTDVPSIKKTSYSDSTTYIELLIYTYSSISKLITCLLYKETGVNM